MCGFIITNKKIKNLKYVNYFLRKRGPDLTNIKKYKNINAVHNLLSLTGKFTPQPFEKKNLICLFNGEIYNYEDFGDYLSDGDCILSSFLKEKENFFKNIDGEFAISIFDYAKNILYLATDLFGTKPLFYSINKKEFVVSTYKSCIKRLNFNNIKKVPNNRFIQIELNQNTFLESEIYKLDISNQHKIDFSDWNIAFEEAINKRSRSKFKQFIALSSGHDSGALGCAMNKLGIKYGSYTISKNENADIIKKRVILNKRSKHKFIKLPNFIWIMLSKFNLRNAEDFTCSVENQISNKVINISYKSDKAANGLSEICRRAKNDGYKIMISGQGPDEIFSDYGFNGRKFNSNSSFGGIFPKNLKEIFPWPNFFKNTMELYLMKEEMVAGAYGIETRYPFLDKKVIQEFLWLDHNLKNKLYKAPISNYLDQNKYPNHKIKYGFNIYQNINFFDKIIHKLLNYK